MKPQKGLRRCCLGGLEAGAHDRLRAFPLCDPASAPTWSRSQSLGATSVWSAVPVSCAHPIQGRSRPSPTMTQPSEGGRSPIAELGCC